MGQQQWLELILLSFVWSISFKQVDSARLLLQLPNIFPPIGQSILPKFNFSLPPISLPQPSPLSSFPSQSQTPPSLISKMPGSIPPTSLPTWPTFGIPPLPSFPWNNPSPPPPMFPWNIPSLSPPSLPWTIPSPPFFPWNIPSPPPPSFPWTNVTTPLPTIPLLPWNSPSPPPPNSQTFPWSIPSSPPPNAQTFPWLIPSPAFPLSSPPVNPQTFPWTNLTNPLPTIPSLPWNSLSSPPPSGVSFPWNTPSPPPLNTPSFPWSLPSPPFLSLPWLTSPPPPSLLPWLQLSPPAALFPWLPPSPPPVWSSSPLPPFGLPPGSPLFPTGIQFTFSNFTQSWLPDAGVKVTWQSTISIELSLQLFVQALMKPITLIITSIQDIKNGPGSWGWQNGLTDSKLGAEVGALCTTSGKDGFPEKGLVIAQTPIDNTITTAVTWFTILFNGWSKDTPPKATLDRTPGSFGGFVTNATVTNLKTFCSHPGSLNRIATKQGQYVLT